MNVKEIVQRYLKDHHFDGLYHPDADLQCCCFAEDLCECCAESDDPRECLPGVKRQIYNENTGKDIDVIGPREP